LREGGVKPRFQMFSPFGMARFRLPGLVLPYLG